MRLPDTVCQFAVPEENVHSHILQLFHWVWFTSGNRLSAKKYTCIVPMESIPSQRSLIILGPQDHFLGILCFPRGNTCSEKIDIS
jgi:hypothetical protein